MEKPTAKTYLLRFFFVLATLGLNAAGTYFFFGNLRPLLFEFPDTLIIVLFQTLPSDPGIAVPHIAAFVLFVFIQIIPSLLYIKTGQRAWLLGQILVGLAVVVGSNAGELASPPVIPENFVP